MLTVGGLCALVVIVFLFFSASEDEAGSSDALKGNVNHDMDYDPQEEIPKILHQSWKTAAVPPQFERWRETWKKNHPHWEMKLWTDEMNRQLVVDHYPWFLDTFDNLPFGIMRADSSRILYMHHEGGVYADLDFESLRQLDDLLVGHKAVIAAMVDEDWDQAIPNAWMAGVKGHPFWLFCLHQIIKMAGAFQMHAEAECRLQKRWDWLEATTGPAMLYHAAVAYKKAGQSGAHRVGAGCHLSH
eukprot:jgi/Botrbrau1/18160/Bobra.53_1s0030.1